MRISYISLATTLLSTTTPVRGTTNGNIEVQAQREMTKAAVISTVVALHALQLVQFAMRKL